MIKRKLFFLFEKLEIKRGERIAVSLLLILLAGLSGVITIQEPYANYNEQTYENLKTLFKEKSKKTQEEHNLILARYKPGPEPVPAEVSTPVKVSVKEEPKVKPNQPDSTDQSGSLININKATNDQLQELPGIGPVYASRIVTWREENGTFLSKDQLVEIKGIGEKRLAKIKPLITL